MEGIQSATNLPLVVSFSFDMGTRTMMGLSPTDAVAAVVPLGIAAVGTNCGRSLADADLVVGEILAAAGDVPVWVKPNAGVPKIVGADVVFEAGPEMLAEHVAGVRRAGRADRRWVLRVDARARRGHRARHSAATSRVSSPRSSGVLLHVTSLPSGRLDEDAYDFVDWLVEAGQSWWQLLPLHIPDALGSPYSSRSAFAGFEGLLSPPRLGPLRRRRGRRRRTAGRLARGVGAFRRRGRAARADAVPARVARAEGVRQRTRDQTDRRHPALRRRRLVRRRHPSARSSTARSSQALRRRRITPRASAGGCRSSTGRRTRRRVRVVAGAARARARAVRPVADRPLPGARQVLGAAARRARPVATARGARDRASRSSTPPASGWAACR